MQVNRQNPDAAWTARLADEIDASASLLFGMAMKILKEPAAAEDACQQALLKAWQHRDHLRERSALRSWLTRVVVNECFAMLRRRKTERKALAAQAQMQPDPQKPVDRTALSESVIQALAELSEQTRMVVVLRLMQGLSGNEVKEILGCSASEVSRRLHQGMETLRASLEDFSALVNR